MLFFPTADEDFKYFRSQGYDGSINDMHYKAMGDLGYTGSLNDRIHAYLVNTYGNFYDAMRGLRNGTLTFSLSAYIVNGFDPDFVLDFKNSYYRKGGSDSTLSGTITHARASSATMTNSSGVLVTVGNNVARTGHHVYNGSAWVNEGILHESEARTNLVTYSNDFNHSTWTKFRVGITENVSGVTGPDGTQTVDKITPIATNEQHRVWYGVSSTAVGETYSAYVKSAGYDYVWVGYYEAPAFKYAIVNLTNGAVTSSNADNYSVEDVSNGFYRISVTKTTSGSSRYISISPSPTASPTIDANGALTYLGDGTSGVYVYGAQIEAGSTPSSYIPTSGSTVTRAADTLTVPAANMPYSSTNMSIQMDGKMTGNNLTHIRWFEDADDAILLETGTNNFTFTQEAGGTVDTVTGGSFTSGNLLAFNTASRHGSGFINGAISGTALTANTTPSALPDLADNNLVLGYDFMGTIAQFRMWDEDLTDAGIAEAST